MWKRWMGVALLAGWLAPAAPAPAQVPAGPAGAAMPEPVPCGPSGCGACDRAMPGPLPAVMAPPGPPDELSLPAGHLSAFSCDGPAEHDRVYFYVGALAFQRQRLGHGVVAYLDPNTRALDTGITPAPVSPKNNPLLDFQDIDPPMQWGGKGTLGYVTGNYALELVGWYLPQTDTDVQASVPGRTNTFFANPPVGFEGDNGLWLQADIVRVTQQTTMGNAEVNVRYFSKAVGGIEPIIGIRYLDLQERLSIFTDDDGILFRDVNGNGDPLRQATYSTRVHNHIVAPQLGADLYWQPLQRLALGAVAKGAWGANFVDREYQLFRGDGFSGFNVQRGWTQFTSVYELNLYADIYITEQMRLRAGYNALWVVHLPEAVDQVNYDLSRPEAIRKEAGSIFFHGPSVEVQFLF